MDGGQILLPCQTGDEAGSWLTAGQGMVRSIPTIADVDVAAPKGGGDENGVRTGRQRSVLLIKSDEIEWADVRGALAAIEGVHVIAETSSRERGVDLAAMLLPDVIVAAAEVEGIPMRPLLSALRRGTCPPSTIVLFADRVGPDEFAEGADRGVDGYFLWRELPAASLSRCLAMVMSAHMVMASRSVVDALVEAQRAPAPDRTCSDLVSARERDVLRRLAEGDSRPEIAAAAGMSVRTVERVIYQLETKLGVSTLVALGAKAAQLGLLP